MIFYKDIAAMLLEFASNQWINVYSCDYPHQLCFSQIVAGTQAASPLNSLA